MHIIVTRAFLIRGERQCVGRLLDVPEAFARELIHTGRASVALSPALAQGDPTHAPLDTPPKKGPKNARKPSNG